MNAPAKKTYAELEVEVAKLSSFTKKMAEIAKANGWDGVNNSKILTQFFEDLIRELHSYYYYVVNRSKTTGVDRVVGIFSTSQDADDASGSLWNEDTGSQFICKSEFGSFNGFRGIQNPHQGEVFVVSKLNTDLGVESIVAIFHDEDEAIKHTEGLGSDCVCIRFPVGETPEDATILLLPKIKHQLIPAEVVEPEPDVIPFTPNPDKSIEIKWGHPDDKGWEPYLGESDTLKNFQRKLCLGHEVHVWLSEDEKSDKNASYPYKSIIYFQGRQVYMNSADTMESVKSEAMSSLSDRCAKFWRNSTIKDQWSWWTGTTEVFNAIHEKTPVDSDVKSINAAVGSSESKDKTFAAFIYEFDKTNPKIGSPDHRFQARIYMHGNPLPIYQSWRTSAFDAMCACEDYLKAIE